MPVPLCESCGAPLEARWAEIVVVCAWCGARNVPGRPGDPVPPSVPDDGRPRFSVAGRAWVLLGHLASGETSEVYEGRWVMRLGERVVVKVLRDPRDADLLRREWDTVGRLGRQGDVQLARRLPQPIAFGPAELGGRERLVAVYRWRPGFAYTLVDVRRAHPGGVDGRIGVWLLKRLVEQLGWAHRAGVVHGAVIPPHVLVHPRDHGAVLVGWATAGPTGAPLVAVARAWRELYASGRGAPLRPEDDVAMAARTVREVCAPLPGGLGALVAEAAAGRHADAWALRERLDAEALAAYGPPSYNPLPMPA